MTASFSGSAAVSASMNVPRTQNTAPVLEFRCLFTQDVRRKQKRWSDGRVKFHTFNKRIMVYDERSNFVGDTHWREDSDFAEGEELELERSGTLVEVGECVGKRDQDLTELVEKRVKEREERAAAKAATPAPSIRTQGTPTSNILRPKPLNALVTPTGHYGRALMPGTSPFEEKKEKDEQERPSKRRKPNEHTSTKSGYAQNLMGATLSLASSRPPSTRPIRYEPVRLTPSIPARAATIDLTLEGSDESDQNNLNARQTNNRAKLSQTHKKTRRSPPPNSGYASNLTGVALTLSSPDNSRPNRPTKFSALRNATIRNAGLRESSSEGEGEFLEILSPETIPAKAKSLGQHKPRPSRPPDLSDLSASPKSTKKTLIEETRPSRSQSVILKSSAVEQTPDRPMSALRIKGRSAPKMMMLMNRPSSRIMATDESSLSDQRKSTPLQKLSETSNDIVLSQASRDLDAFHQKQEERLQARLRGERGTLIMETEKTLPPPDDIGIDHQTIDRLLSRRKRPVEKVVTISSDRNPSSLIAADNASGREESQSAQEELKEERILPSSISYMSSPTIDADIPEALPPHDRDAPPCIQTETVAEAFSRTKSQSPLGTSIHEEHALSPGFQDGHESTPDLFQHVQTRNTMPGPQASVQNPRKAKPLPDHVVRDNQGATEHFRAVVKSSTSQQHEIKDILPRLPDPAPETPKPTDPVSRNPEMGDDRQTPEFFPEMIRPEKNVVEEHELSESTILGIVPALPTNVLKLPVVQSMPPPRRVLANPATRGKSVQALAANTIDTLNNASIIMAPPSPPRWSSRSETINNGGLNDVGRGPDGRVTTNETSDVGPWSRDAFDLFDKKTCERIMILRAASTATG